MSQRSTTIVIGKHHSISLEESFTYCCQELTPLFSEFDENASRIMWSSMACNQFTFRQCSHIDRERHHIDTRVPGHIRLVRCRASFAQRIDRLQELHVQERNAVFLHHRVHGPMPA